MQPIILFPVLQINSSAYRVQGRNYEAAASFFLVHTEPGKGAALHTHPYEAISIVQEGVVTFVVGTETLTATGGHVIIVPPETRHKFTNISTPLLRQLSIHPSKAIIQTSSWKSDRRAATTSSAECVEGVVFIINNPRAFPHSMPSQA